MNAFSSSPLGPKVISQRDWVRSKALIVNTFLTMDLCRKPNFTRDSRIPRTFLGDNVLLSGFQGLE